MKLIQIAATILLVSRATTCHELKLVTGPQQSQVKRQQVAPGWALVEDLCPPGNGGCGKRSCCPIGTYCDAIENSNSNFCCLTRDVCGYEVEQNSRCADDTWVMWLTIKDPICCMPGEIGVQPGPGEYYGHCVAADSSVPTNSRATLAGASSTTVPASSSSFVASTGSLSTTESSSAHSTPTSVRTTAAVTATTALTPSQTTSTTGATSNSVADSKVKCGAVAYLVMEALVALAAGFM